MKFLNSLLLGITMTVLPALAQQGPITYGSVLPTNTVIGGKTIGALAVDAWNWIYSIGTNENPQLDCGSGRWANNRQPNPLVFYIAPVTTSGTGECVRTFTVPENKHILLPVMAVTLENIDIIPAMELHEMRAVLDDLIGIPLDLFATLNGSPVTNVLEHRHWAPEFSYIFPDSDNVSTVFYGKPISGLVDPIISDGYWLLLEPLATGSHSFHTGGENPYQVHDMSFTIEAQSVPLEQWADALKAWVKSADLRPPLRGRLMAEANAARRSIRKQKIGAAIRRLRSFHAVASQSSKSPEPELARYAERMIVRAGKEL